MNRTGQRHLSKLRLLSILFSFGVLFINSKRLQAQDTVRVCHYNILEYGISGSCPSTSDKNIWMNLFMSKINPDVFTVNELSASSALHAENILQNVMQQFNSSFERATHTNNSGSNFSNALFYNSDKFGIADEQVINHWLRDINYYKLYYKSADIATTQDTIFLEFVVVHYKAVSGATDKITQQQQGAAIMSFLDGLGRPGNIVLCGDLNVEKSTDSSYSILINHANNDVRFYDPINKPGNWATGSMAAVHTQSTRTSSGSCGSGGGMDDRFDQILVSNFVMNDSDRVNYVPGSYFAYGNDGNVYNGPISNTTAVSQQIANALQDNSDHLPVVMDLAITANTVSRAPEESLQLSIFPNPSSGVFNINFASSLIDPTFELFDMRGQEMKLRSELTSNGKALIDTNELPTGIYLLKMSVSGGNFVVKKLIKK